MYSKPNHLFHHQPKVDENNAAFLRAAELGDIDRVEELLPEVDVNYADEGGRTALILAAINGQGSVFSGSIVCTNCGAIKREFINHHLLTIPLGGGDSIPPTK